MTIIAGHPADEFQSVRVDPYTMHDATPIEVERIRETLAMRPFVSPDPAAPALMQEVRVNGPEGWEEI